MTRKAKVRQRKRNNKFKRFLRFQWKKSARKISLNEELLKSPIGIPIMTGDELRKSLEKMWDKYKGKYFN